MIVLPPRTDDRYPGSHLVREMEIIYTQIRSADSLSYY